jgi:hypothetical protein
MILLNKNYFREYGVLIVSSGGCGCTYLNKAISKHVDTNPLSNADHFKHLYSPKSHLLNFNKINKIIFVYNDPLLAIVSHFRRGWAVMQHKQISPINEHIDESILQNQHTYFRYVIKNKRDGFGIINHALRWKSFDRCVFVDMRDITKTQNTISEYLNVDIKLESKKRSSDLSKVPQEAVELYRAWDNFVLNY